MEPRVLSCVDCGAQFEFTMDEQAQFAERGFSAPKRCKTCRQAKRRRQSDKKDAPARPEQRRPDAPPAQRRAAVMRATQCTACGAPTEVPFEPDGMRPIYCLPCLKQRTR